MSYTYFVEFDDVILELTYSIEGKYHAAGLYSPGERPHPEIERCVLLCGDVRAPCDFQDLPELMREGAMYHLQDEVDSLREPVEEL